MKLQILVSSLNQEVKSLAEKMNLQADAILINQCNENRYEEWTQDGHRIRCYHLAERGVGLSRNNALLRADADLCLFSDEDIVYDDGAAERDDVVIHLPERTNGQKGKSYQKCSFVI